MLTNYNHLLYDYLVEHGVAESTATYLNALGLLIAALLLVFCIDLIARRIIRTISERLSRLTKTDFDDIAVKNKVPHYLAHIIPLALLMEFLPTVFVDFQYAENIAIKIGYVLGVVLVLYIVRSLLNSIRDYLKILEPFRDKPIDSYIQVFMIFAWVAGLLAVFAIVLDTTVWKFLDAVGAPSAVILFIYKESILGFVASRHVNINDMVRIGD